MRIAVVVVVALVVVLLWAIATYNRLVRTRNKVEEGWAGIDVQLQRRADLVPNLVSTVRGYADHEDRVLEEVTRARAAMVAADGVAAADAADNALTGALRSLFAVAEAYPDLKASDNFLELQRQLAEIEEELSFSRRYYNAVVEDLNTAIQSFPTMLLARPMGFEPATYFRAADGARSVPAADFGA